MFRLTKLYIIVLAIAATGLAIVAWLGMRPHEETIREALVAEASARYRLFIETERAATYERINSARRIAADPEVVGRTIYLNSRPFTVVGVAAPEFLGTSADYRASKAALISLAESLYPELRPQGVRLRLINPGFVRSALTDKNDFQMPFLISPEQAAQEIIKRLPRDSFEIAFPTPFAVILKFMRCLPYRLFFYFMQRLLK